MALHLLVNIIHEWENLWNLASYVNLFIEIEGRALHQMFEYFPAAPRDLQLIYHNVRFSKIHSKGAMSRASLKS